MDKGVEKIVRKNNWHGLDNLTKDWCEHCNQFKWLSKMDNHKQGICKDCNGVKKKVLR